MTKREIAAMACKILSVYAVISGVGSMQYNLGFLISQWSFRSSPAGAPLMLSSVVSFVPLTLQMLFGALLWVFSDALAVLMAGDDNGPVVAPAVTGGELYAIALSCLGVLMMAEAAPRIGGYIFQLLINNYSVSTPLFGRSAAVSGLLTAPIQLLVGLALVMGNRGRIRLMQAAKHIGRDRAPVPLIDPSVETSIEPGTPPTSI